MLAIKILSFLWPFIKEMVLGKHTLIEAIRKNAKRFFFMSAFFASIGLNILMIPRLVQISNDYINLNKKYEAILKKNEILNTQAFPKPDKKPDVPAVGTVKEPDKPTGTVVEIHRPVNIVGKPKGKIEPAHHNEQTSSHLDAVRADFAKMKEREDRESAGH